jgi:hypothetical protein
MTEEIETPTNATERGIYLPLTWLDELRKQEPPISEQVPIGNVTQPLHNY